MNVQGLEEMLALSEVKKISLTAGDVLAVYVPRDISDDEAAFMSERLKIITGLDVKAFILPPGYDVGVISREEADV